jgi:hypothetical protein
VGVPCRQRVDTGGKLISDPGFIVWWKDRLKEIKQKDKKQGKVELDSGEAVGRKRRKVDVGEGSVKKRRKQKRKKKEEEDEEDDWGEEWGGNAEEEREENDEEEGEEVEGEEEDEGDQDEEAEQLEEASDVIADKERVEDRSAEHEEDDYEEDIRAEMGKKGKKKGTGVEGKVIMMRMVKTPRQLEREMKRPEESAEKRLKDMEVEEEKEQQKRKEDSRMEKDYEMKDQAPLLKVLGQIKRKNKKEEKAKEEKKKEEA